MKQQVILVLLLHFLLIGGIFFPTIVKAQGPPDSNTEIFTDPDLPIDGGVGLLIAAGVAYGVKRVREERKRKGDMSI